MNRILVVKQTSLGDVLHITPFLRAVKKHMPSVEIDVVVDKRAVPILAHNPNVARLHVIDVYRYERELFRSPASFIRVIREFASEVRKVAAITYDAALDLQGLLRSLLFVYAANAPLKVAKGKHPFLVPRYTNRNEHAVKAYVSFLSALDVPEDGYALDMYLPDDIEVRTRNTLKSAGVTLPDAYLVYAPYSRWISKDVPFDASVSLLHALHERFRMPILLSATGDAVDEYAKMLDACEGVISLAGITSIPEMAYVISRAEGMVSVDSFPMHVASAFNVPLVALFGPTSEHRIGPLSSRSRVLRSDMPCARCYNRRCRENVCMTRIGDARIVDTLALLMDGVHAKKGGTISH